LIGTMKSKIGYGGTMPFVSPPFAMTNWTPQTRQNKISVTSYEYDDKLITGFIGTHQPAIWMGDYGYITLMPQVGELQTTPEARGLAFSHSEETAKPDHYAVSLRTAQGARIRAEMTATERCAFLRFRFPDAGVARVLVEISRTGVPGLPPDQAREITGYNPHRSMPTSDRQLLNFVAILWFSSGRRRTAPTHSHESRAPLPSSAWAGRRDCVGTSFLSIDQARDNLRREIPD
jgi:putative alpha-1,2-mannosidase